MDSDTKFWLRLWSVCLATICAIAATVAGCVCVQTHLYTSHGYTRATLPGGSYPEWVKEGK